MIISTIVVILFILGGVFFFATATIGLLRFPDFYCRMHATGKGDTLGALLALIGLALYNLHHGFSLDNVHRHVYISGQPCCHPCNYESGAGLWCRDLDKRGVVPRWYGN
jgi:monovalent cation/proton antiporter MnhG/PhaG subunit